MRRGREKHHLKVQKAIVINTNTKDHRGGEATKKCRNLAPGLKKTAGSGDDRDSAAGRVGAGREARERKKSPQRSSRKRENNRRWMPSNWEKRQKKKERGFQELESENRLERLTILRERIEER